ncbi:MAG: hypothetical protein JNK11_05460 [Alphaproteobacteria bacterium]|nr:hypothetical protein [Alphaproteobacteria bacterium]
MSFVYLVAAGVVAYVVSDLALRAAERWRGRPFAERSVVFLLIMTATALALFWLIRTVAGA